MPKPNSYKFRLIYFLVFIVVFVIGFPILVFYSAGYTFDDTFSFSGLSIRGGIYVFTPEQGTSVFVGNELKNTSGFFKKEILVDHLKPGQYLVLAANDLYWPWAKFVNVERGEVEALFPLMVPKDIPATEVLKTDSDYKDAQALFLVSATSTAMKVQKSTTTPVQLIRRKVHIWLDGNTIMGQWTGDQEAAPKYFCLQGSCMSPVQVFKSFVAVRSFDFYPVRDDAIILALDNGIYAMEIDSRMYQNFYPIYRGKTPDFRVDGSDVYVKDDGKIFLLDLEP